MSRVFYILWCILMGVQASSQEVIYQESDIGVQRLFIEANKYKLLAKYDKAIEAYETIIESDPINGPVYYDLARVHLAMKDYDQAAKSIKKAISFESDNIWYLLTAADIYAYAEDCEAQVKSLTAILKLKDDYDLLKRLYGVQLHCDHYKAALLTIQQIESTYGDDISWLDEKVNILLQEDQRKAALKEVQQYVQQYPRDIDGLERLANILLVLDKKKNGKEVLKQIIERDPYNEYALYQIGIMDSQSESQEGSMIAMVKDPRLDIDYKIKSLLPIIQSPLDSAIISELELCAAQLTSDYPNNAKSHALRGDIRMLAGEYPKAIMSYEKTLSIDKSNYAVWGQLLYAYMLRSSYDQLLEASEQAMDYYPNQSAPYLYHAVARYEMGSSEAALEDIQEFRFISSDETLLNDISYLIESKIAQNSGNTTKAISILKDYIDNNTIVNPNIYDLLGDLYLEDGDKEKAQYNWQKSLELGGSQELLQAKIQSI